MWTIIVCNPEGHEHCRTYLRPGVVAVIGRGADCTITLTPMSVSRRHGRIELRGGVPVYFDDESSTGTKVDGAYIRGPTQILENTVLEIAGYKFTAERTIPAKKSESEEPAGAASSGEWVAEAAADFHDQSPEALLARRIQGIRQHREQSEQDAQAKQSRFVIEWKQLVQSARRLQEQLAGDPRILAFTVSRDEDEVLVKIRDSSARGYSSIILASRHPNGKYPDLDAAWVLELGREDKFFQKPQEAMEEFVERLAPRLA